MDLIRLIMGQIQQLDAELAASLEKLQKVKQVIAALKESGEDKAQLAKLKTEAELLSETIRAIHYRIEAKVALLEGFKILFAHKIIPPEEEHLRNLIRQEIVIRGLDTQANKLALEHFGKTFAQLEGLELIQFWRVLCQNYNIDSLLF